MYYYYYCYCYFLIAASLRLGGQVFDVTNFLLEHPGGEEVILENAGRDATLAFRGVGHSALALRALDDYLVGILCHTERIYANEESYRRGDR